MTTRPRVVYIAGPYRAPHAWGVEQNIRRAEEISAQVWGLGLVALCPHANSRHMDGSASDEAFLAGTMELLRRCDAVFFVPGWGKSSGTRAEHAEAVRLGLPRFNEASEHIDPVARRALADASIGAGLCALRIWAVKPLRIDPQPALPEIA